MAEQDKQPSTFDIAFLTGGVGEVGEVLLIRHGQQEYDPRGTTQDLIDPPLSEHGRAQAQLLGKAFADTELAAIYASPLQRANDTAAALAGHHELEVQVIDDLREIEIFRDVPRDKPPAAVLSRELLEAARLRMVNELSWDVYPLSEGSQEFRKRTVNAVEVAIVAQPAKRIAIVCHGGVINSYIAHIIGARGDMFFRPAHTAVSVIVAGRRRRALRSLNDVYHLRTAEGDFTTY
ncbi:MAG: histidine phosphatase family protein [Chloroflexi bacterium]|nr:histidine phosphatase family protein [Chloroflexota bacterium]